MYERARWRDDDDNRYNDEELVSEAVRLAGHRATTRAYRWSHVMEVFAVGSTVARLLCARFGYDPDEVVGDDPTCPHRCEECEELEAERDKAVP